MNPFEIKDCALLVRMSGLPPAFNLRELRERIASCSDNVLYHHFCETTLRPTFDNPDYRNDFAVWVKLHLADRVLAEQLGILDPFSCASFEELRSTLLELIDQRLSELPYIPSVVPGYEFHFQEATTVVFDTGERIASPPEMAGAVARMTRDSIFFHFLEARRRTPGNRDDFTSWLEGWGKAGGPYVEALRNIDFYFYTLKELRDELVRALSGPGGPG